MGSKRPEGGLYRWASLYIATRGNCELVDPKVTDPLRSYPCAQVTKPTLYCPGAKVTDPTRSDLQSVLCPLLLPSAFPHDPLLERWLHPHPVAMCQERPDNVFMVFLMILCFSSSLKEEEESLF
ncbi:hypothetical protein EOD39_2586 [Acipenser ruthenus]|uniref:Uncharacterized protein n=1 Tax=Acipenser ruthenus TaxID=7906 RepID=A0A444U052_ACIRT|nr:hypothetical protein EOD39_2586 [Acipenser ruthenus]